jgi:DnaJ-class molecular chaperone
MSTSSKNHFICAECKGTGHVRDTDVRMGGPIFWLIGLFERKDYGGLTRKPCPKCHGRGLS